MLAAALERGPVRRHLQRDAALLTVVRLEPLQLVGQPLPLGPGLQESGVMVQRGAVCLDADGVQPVGQGPVEGCAPATHRVEHHAGWLSGIDPGRGQGDVEHGPRQPLVRLALVALNGGQITAEHQRIVDAQRSQERAGLISSLHSLDHFEQCRGG